jgi:hypothetical protein
MNWRLALIDPKMHVLSAPVAGERRCSLTISSINQ